MLQETTLFSQDLFAASKIRVTPWTILNRVNDAGLCYRPIRCPALTAARKAQCFPWWNEKGKWNADWHTVIFNDESCFCLRPDRPTVRVWRPRNSRVNDRFVQEVHPFGGGGIMVRGEFFYRGRTELYVCEGTMKCMPTARTLAGKEPG